MFGCGVERRYFCSAYSAPTRLSPVRGHHSVVDQLHCCFCSLASVPSPWCDCRTASDQSALGGYLDQNVNPFSLKQPLQFFHLIGFFFIVAGLAAIVVALLKHLEGLEPWLPIALGAGILLGVQCCMFLFRRKLLRRAIIRSHCPTLLQGETGRVVAH